MLRCEVPSGLPTGRGLVAALALLAVLAVLPVAPAGANGITEAADTLYVVKEDGTPSNVDIAVALSQATPLEPERVLVGRDDRFADSMAAGVLQSDSPLLLVPPGGPVPPQVLAELARLDPARVTLLGGEAAITPVVEAELVDAGYATERRAGPSRFETAIRIADEVSAPDTVILARAFAAEGAPESQAFADSLAAGGLAANHGWPIVLTDSEALSGPTEQWLAATRPQRVLIMGGTAAISQAVQDGIDGLGIETQRVAGGSRFETAVEAAKESGAQSAADVARVTLVEAGTEDAWAGGFAAAAHAAFFDAPIVLGAGEELHAATEAFLSGTPQFAQADDTAIRLTCVVAPVACESGRVLLGLPPVVPVTFDPPTGSAVTPGRVVVVDTGQTQATIAGGTCAPGSAEAPLPATGEVTITGQVGTTCELVIVLNLPGDVVQTETAVYTILDERTPLAVDAGGTIRAADSPDMTPDGSIVAFRTRGDLRVADDQSPTFHTWVWKAGVRELIDVRPDGTLATGHSFGPQLSADGRYVAFDSNDSGLDSSGRIGNADPTSPNTYLRDRVAGTATLVSLGPDGQALEVGRLGGVSDDGAVVAYLGQVPGTDENGNRQFSIFTATPGQPGRQITGADGQPWTTIYSAESIRISGDGSTVVFATEDPNLVAGDVNQAPNSSVKYDVFALDVASGTVERVSVPGPGQQQEGGRSVTYNGTVDVSSDGRLVAFYSDADNMPGSVGDDVRRMYLHDRDTGQTREVDLTVTGQDPVGPNTVEGVYGPALSADGSLLGLQVVDSRGCGTHVIDLEAGTARTLFEPTAGGGCTGAAAAVADSGAVALVADDSAVPGDTGGQSTVVLLAP